MPQAVSRTLSPVDLVTGYFDGNTWYVDGSGTVTRTRDGLAFDSAFATITAALAVAVAGDRIFVAEGVYDETVTVPNAITDLEIIGCGTRLGAAIQPSAANAGALIVRADDVTVRNIDFASNGSGVTALITGRRFHDVGCKFEGGATQYKIGPGTVATIAAGTDENASDSLSEDAEICWGTDGIQLYGSDYGATTQNRFRRTVFHNLTGKEVTEATGSGGAIGVRYRNLELSDCTFDNQEDGSQPTKYLDLNGDNANTGIVKGCTFPQAINGGRALVSTAVKFVGNYMTGGLSAAQPS